MSDGYDVPVRHTGGWRINSDGGSSGSSRTASSRPPSTEFDDDDSDDLESQDSMIAIPPNVPSWNVKRHLTAGNPAPTPDTVKNLDNWRGKDTKLKTVHAALVLCLNIGVDPPDIVKTNPCAVLECWIDPFSLPPSKALDAIGKNLVHQFETLNPRMRYKQYPDPSIDDTRRFCAALRKLVKDERALFYYNGHGVPKPTASGEIWVFNKTYTQYIPLSLQELQGYLGSPTIYVWDCSAAGNILENFERLARKRDAEFYAAHPDPAAQASYSPFLDCIHVAACGADEVLPMSPDLPADVFTSALTSPIEMALRFYVLQNSSRLSVSIEDAMKIPGDLKDRRTPLGELNWIFTAVTDTIAWTTFPKDLFKRLFRQDWTLAALFRNFLLAERIMRKYNCTPRAYPALPPAHMHPLWASWDLAVDKVMVQLPNLLAQVAPPSMDPTAAPPWQYENVASVFFEEHLQAFFVWLNRGGNAPAPGEAPVKRGQMVPDTSTTLPAMKLPTLDDEEVVHQSPDDVIASTTGRHKPSSRVDKQITPRKPPDQLPILLQVLLSQTHRLRALILLGNFIDLGPWAVHLALTIGIFPYVQKLLQSPAAELRPVLTYIWCRVIAFDQSIQVDLLKDSGHAYFANLLKPDIVLAIPNELEHKAMCAFIMAMECRDHPTGQHACFQLGLFTSCVAGLQSKDYLMRQWSALALGLLWDGFDEAKAFGIEVLRVHKLLETLVVDDSAEVRAAIFYALSTLFGASASKDQTKRGGGGMGSLLHLNERDHLGFELKLGLASVLAGAEDASPMVRKEMVVMLSTIVFEWRGWFVVAAWAYWEGSRAFFSSLIRTPRRPHPPTQSNNYVWEAIARWAERSSSSSSSNQNQVPNPELSEHNHVVVSTVFTLYATLLELTCDPYPEVAAMARTVADWVIALLKDSPFARLPGSTIGGSAVPEPLLGGGGLGVGQGYYPRQGSSIAPSIASDSSRRSSLAVGGSTAGTSLPPATESALTSTLKRTSSIANSIRSLAAGYAFPSLAEKEHEAMSLSSSPPTPLTNGHHHHLTDGEQNGNPNPPPPPPPNPHPPRYEYKAAVPEPRYHFVKYVGPYVVSSTTSSSNGHQSGLTRHASIATLPGITTTSTSIPADRRSIASAPHHPRRGGGGGPTFTTSTPSETSGSSPETSMSMSASASFTPSDVIEALVDEDWERLRVRRRAGAHARDAWAAQKLAHPLPHQHQYGHAQRQALPSMTSSFTSTATESDEGSGSWLGALGTGTGGALANVLPLKSAFFDWSMEYFTEPQMRAAEDEEPGSVIYNEQLWRGQRNERIVNDTKRQAATASSCHWDKSLVTIQNNHPVRLLKFHQYETHLITANNDKLVSVWDWAKRKRIACFDNGNPEGTSVTSVHFINEDLQAQIITASADGMVRVFSNYDPETSFDDAPLELCSSFRALPHISPSEFRSGAIADWLQPYGLLVVGGDSKVIKIWDAHKEMVSADIETEMGSCVTAIASDLDNAALVLAASGDGKLSIYDRRTMRREIPMRTHQCHRSWVQNVHWQRGSSREIISGSLDGQVILWDIRSPQGKIMEWEPHGASGLANLAVHDQTGVFATTSGIGKGPWRQQTIIVQSLPPLRTPVTTALKVPITPPVTRIDGLLPQGFFPSPGSLAFHPHEMMVGWGGYDGRIKIYGCNLNDPNRVQEPEPDFTRAMYGFGSPLPSISSTMES